MSQISSEPESLALEEPPTQGVDASDSQGVGTSAELLGLSNISVAGGRFVLQQFLGRGGQGAVYQLQRQQAFSAAPPSAELANLSDQARFIPRPSYTPDMAAVKLFVPDPQRPSLTERFIAEYRVAARLKEGPFVRAYEMFEHDKMLCYTMDLMLGGSLAQAVGCSLPPAVAVGLVLDVLEALDILHSRGIVHRDIKHSNILLGESLPVELRGASGNPDNSVREVRSALPARIAAHKEGCYRLPQARLTDFGISDVQDMFFGDRAFYSLAGTLQFMAPEMAKRDRVDARVDLFAVGVLLFMLLTGRHPASSSTSRGQTELALHRRMAGADVQELLLKEVALHVPAEITAVATKLLEADPDRRIRTAALAFDPLYAWFSANKDKHRIELSHEHRLAGRPYLAASIFCGRSAELGQARALLEENKKGRQPETSASAELPTELPADKIPASVLMLWGEAGVGKTRLTGQIRKRADEMGYKTHSLQSKRGQGAYQDLREFQQYLEDEFARCQNEPDVTEQTKQRDPRHSHFVPDKARDAVYAPLRQQEVRPEERSSYEELHASYQLERFAALIRLHSYSQPLCIFIEDAQWLDQATIKFVFFAIRFLSASKSHGHPCQVAWVLNHRPKDPEGDSLDAVAEQLRNIERLEQAPISIQLSSFGVEDATKLAASMLQLSPSDPALGQFIEKMADRRELTPLFVEQALWSLFSQGSLELPTTHGRWQGMWNLDPGVLETANLPLSVREAIGSRASRLTTETLRILGIAAISGKAFDVEVVARAADTEAGSVLAACEQAGREGFVLQEQEEHRTYLADSGTGVVRYRFTHDRYRESIREHLDSGVARKIHSALAQAFRKRLEKAEQTESYVADHHYNAEEYADAYVYARRVAEHAHAEGQHERAVQYYQLAIDSHDKDLANRQRPVPQELRSQAAQSLQAIGRLKEANVQLEALLGYPDLSAVLRLDCERRIAESYFQQQDYKQALAPMLKCLEQMGVRLPSNTIEALWSGIRGMWAMMGVGSHGWFLNTREAPDADREAVVMQTLSNLMEGATFIDHVLVVRIVNYGAVRATQKGLHPYSAAWFGIINFMLSMLGMRRLSRRCDQRISELFPHCESFAVAEGNSIPRKEVIPDLVLRSYNTNAIARIAAQMIRGDFVGIYASRVEQRIREALVSIFATTDLRRRWVTLGFCGIMGLFAGRVSIFHVLMRSALEVARTYNQPAIGETLRNLIVGSEAFLNGNLDQAESCFQGCKEVAEKWGDRMFIVIGQSQGLLCNALGESVPSISVLAEALRAVRFYQDIKYSASPAWGQSAALAAAALVLYRQGGRKVPAELPQLMRRAWVQCHLEHHQRAVYRAAQATLAAVQKEDRRRNQLFALAAKEAESDGLLYQLLWVLRIALRVLPDGSEEKKYYQKWQDQLQKNLRQPPITLRELEIGSFPPPPVSGRPYGASR